MWPRGRRCKRCEALTDAVEAGKKEGKKEEEGNEEDEDAQEELDTQKVAERLARHLESFCFERLDDILEEEEASAVECTFRGRFVLVVEARAAGGGLSLPWCAHPR